MSARSCVTLISMALLLLTVGRNNAAFASDTYLPAIGGSGGGQFFEPCPAGQNLSGFDLRTADDVDAIRPLCVTAYSSGVVTNPPLTNGSGLVQHYANASREVLGAPYSELLGDWSELPKDWHGGTGGGLTHLICPHDKPIVIAMYVAAEGAKTVIVNNIHLFCGHAVASQALDPNPSAIFDGPGFKPTSGLFGTGSNGSETSGSQRCADGQVAVGMHGRSGVWLDAMGLICDAPRVMPAPIASIGRGVSPVGGMAPHAAASICDLANEARSRNSPAAPGLEAKCAASKVVASIGRVESPVSDGGPQRPICDLAKEARTRNSPAAAGLESKCIDELASRGEAIANQDPLSAELRTRTRNDQSRRGFDAGMAAAEGSTQAGPEKQVIHNALAGIEQAAFDLAVSFSLQRNSNAPLAAIGAAIAAQDPDVARARTADRDVFYWLGFDIATGIFGDPALGAQGHTAAGPGSNKIRDALSPAAQRGFNAATSLHLGRSYK